MSGLEKLDLDRHARGLQRVAGADLGVAVCGDDGSTLWVASSGAAVIQRALADLEGDLPNSGTDVERMDLGGGRSLLYAPVIGRGGSRLAWLAGLATEANQTDCFDSLREALHDAAHAIAHEFSLHQDVESLSTELSQRYEELNLVYSLENQVRSFNTSELGAQNLMSNFADLLDVDLATFVGSQKLSAHALRPNCKIDNLDFVLTKLNNEIFRFVSASRAPLVMNDVDDPRRPYLFVNLSFRLLAVPVMHDGRVESVLVLLRRMDGPEFSNGDRNLANVVAGQTALLVRNHGMLLAMRTFSEQIASALITAVEAKDPYTRGHSERVQKISCAIAKGADLQSHEVEEISWGALLHDIGKIGIPDAILCKVERLTEDEFTLIKIHPERSYEILSHIESLSGASALAARYHQERFDGKGYPVGLSGHQIPMHARVIAVADTYDAITSSRAYRAGQNHTVALAEIVRVAGSQLDPTYVGVFERMCRESVNWLEAITGRSDADDG